MQFTYLTDEEYQRAFDHFGGVRTRIAELMRSESRRIPRLILDVPAGHGYLSAEFSKSFPNSTVVGVGLPSDFKSYFELRESGYYAQDVWSRVMYLGCDSTHLSLADSSCDMVVNFLGLEDVNMTRGTDGLGQTLSEMFRVVKREGFIQISIVEYGKTPEERVASDVWKTIGLNAVFYEPKEYIRMLEELGLRILRETTYEIPKKMTSKQAAEELQFACEMAPQIFAPFRVRAIPFHELWAKFGDRIEKHGMAYWSRIRVIVCHR